MIEDLCIAPYERRHIGPRNQFLFRKHDTLPEQAARAILKRQQPAWSQRHVEVRFG